MNKKQRFGLFGMLSLIFSLVAGLAYLNGMSNVTMIIFTVVFIVFTNLFLKD